MMRGKRRRSVCERVKKRRSVCDGPLRERGTGAGERGRVGEIQCRW